MRGGSGGRSCGEGEGGCSDWEGRGCSGGGDEAGNGVGVGGSREGEGAGGELGSGCASGLDVDGGGEGEGEDGSCGGVDSGAATIADGDWSRKGSVAGCKGGRLFSFMLDALGPVTTVVDARLAEEAVRRCVGGVREQRWGAGDL